MCVCMCENHIYLYFITLGHHAFKIILYLLKLRNERLLSSADDICEYNHAA